MTGRKITENTALVTQPTLTDLMQIVDVSDATDAASGTNKKITVDNLMLNRLTKSIVAFGGVGDGVTDNTAAFAAAEAEGNPLIIPKGTYLLDADETLSIPLMFQGGKIQVETGRTLTINSWFWAKHYQIFTGAGTVDISGAILDYVVPQWWGALGDSSTNDTAAFASALATSQPVFVPPPTGQYVVGDLLIPDQTVIYGKTGLNVGFSSVTARTVIKRLSGAVTIFDISGCQGTHIHDLVLHGVDKGTHGICAVTDDSSNMQIQNVAVLFCDYAIGALSGFYIGGSWIMNCNLGISEYGIIRLLDSHINHNKIRTNNEDGIYLPTGMNDCMITGNKIEWNQGHGIHAVNSDHHVITGNLFDRSFKSGILVDATGGVTITGNVIRRCGRNAVSEQRSLILCKNTNTKLVISGNTGTAGRDDGSYDITGITQANPAVVTSVAHGRSTGEKIYIRDVVGMTEVNDIEFTATVLTDDTLSLDGINSSGYTAYSSSGSFIQGILSPNYGIEFVNTAAADITITGNDFSCALVNEYIGNSSLTNATISRNNGKEFIVGREINCIDGVQFQDKQTDITLTTSSSDVLSLTQQPVNTYINAPRNLQVVIRNKSTGADYFALFPLLLKREGGNASISAGGVFAEVGTAGAITISGSGSVADLVISNVAADGSTFDVTTTNNTANSISVTLYLI